MEDSTAKVGVETMRNKIAGDVDALRITGE